MSSRPRRVCGRLNPLGESVGVGGCLASPSPDYEELPEGSLLAFMNGLMLISGILQSLDKCPKRIESFIDALRASFLLGSGREIELDGGKVGGEHDSGSSPVRCFLDPSAFGTIPHWRSPFEADFCEAKILSY